jgi:hypothetical protein
MTPGPEANVKASQSPHEVEITFALSSETIRERMSSGATFCSIGPW